MSEDLIFASTNPQYDDRLYIELQVQYLKIPSSEQGENKLYTHEKKFTKNILCPKILNEFTKFSLKNIWQTVEKWFFFTKDFKYLSNLLNI